MAGRQSIAGRWRAWRKELATLEGLAEAGYLLLLAGFFVLETRPHRLLLYALTPVFLFWLRRHGPWRQIKDSSLVWLGLAYLGLLWLSQFWSAGWDLLDLWTASRQLVFATLFLVLSVALFARRAGLLDRALKVYAGAALATVAAALAYGAASGALFTSNGGEGLFSARLVGFGRADHPILGAALAGTAHLIIVFYLLPRAIRHRWLGVLGALVLLGFMVATQSRGPLVALAATWVVALLLAGRWLFVPAVLLLVLLPVAGYLWAGLDPLGLVARGAGPRLAIWAQALEWIGEAPLFGHGIATEIRFEQPDREILRSPHNIVLASLVYVGVVGTALLAALFGVALWRALARPADARCRLVGLLLVFGIGCGMTDYRSLLVNLNPEWIAFWFPLAAIAAIATRSRVCVAAKAVSAS